jgi:hypothetical protein
VAEAAVVGVRERTTRFVLNKKRETDPFLNRDRKREEGPSLFFVLLEKVQDGCKNVEFLSPRLHSDSFVMADVQFLRTCGPGFYAGDVCFVPTNALIS